MTLSKCKPFFLFISLTFFLSCGQEDDFLLADPTADVDDIFAPQGNNCRLKRMTSSDGANGFFLDFIHDDKGRIIQIENNNKIFTRGFITIQTTE